MFAKGVGMTGRAAWIFGGFVLFSGSCDEDDVDAYADDDEAIELRAVGDNGWSLNGWSLNGWSLNGWSLNGWSLNGDQGTSDYITAVDLSYDSIKVTQMWLEGSELVIKLVTGAVVRGTAMNKMKVKYEMIDGGPLRKKSIWIRNATQAILLGGVWDPDDGDRRAVQGATLTYACRGAALAKCVEWGYKPWALAGGTSLYDFHQACTRMVRADYCGEGVAHTVNGTPIHVLDQYGVQVVDPNVNYAVEAEWGPDGALCLNSGNTRLPGQTIECSLPACGTSFSSGGLIQSGKVLSGP
jgi:hypothetical protein